MIDMVVGGMAVSKKGSAAGHSIRDRTTFVVLDALTGTIVGVGLSLPRWCCVGEVNMDWRLILLRE